MDMINAQGKQVHRSAVSTREGVLFSKIQKITQKLITILGELAAWVDYPEEDLPEIETETLNSSLSTILSELDELILSYDSGRILREGIDTVILGKPNVGKSTLMNMLSGFQRSIVTEIAGTTRDIVEESVRVGDILLRLSDTAGLRATDDVVEGFGVSLAYKKLKTADLVIAVFDNSEILSDEDLSLIDSLSTKPCVAVINKSDLEAKVNKDILSTHFNKIVEISAKNNEGINRLSKAIEDIFNTNQFDPNVGVISNERQKACVDTARKNIAQAINVLMLGETYDAITVLIDAAASSLMELTGEKTTEAVVNEIFSHFCVGK